MTVIIATHQREQITKSNIDSLLMQSEDCKIVLVVSERKELEYFKNLYSTITIVQAPNNPLGTKWQQGVNAARTGCEDGIIIVGSDDILGIDFVKNASRLMREGYDFVGLMHWYCYHAGLLYHMKYNANIPLGCRIYSKRFLDSVRWKIFDVGKNKHLDDLGYEKAKPTHYRVLMDGSPEGLNVVSIKGNWTMLNEFHRLVNSRNVTVLSKSRLKEDLKKLIGDVCVEFQR